VGYSRDDDKPFLFIDCVHDAVVANTDPKVVATGKLCSARRSGIGRQAIDRGNDAFRNRSMEPAIRLDRLRMEADFVTPAWYYLRTFDQGIAWSTSSRA
jgi:hypothetical protein